MVLHKTDTEEEGLSTAMRFVLHLIGDLHQPLHTTARVNKKYPKGDTGGNAFKLPNRYGAKNLHSVWDKVFYEWKSKSPKLPFSDADWDTLGEKSREYMKQYKITKKI